MFRPRVIPVLLLKNKGLVKTLKFNKSTYVGDPMNAVKIFNELEADELFFLDINATKEQRILSLDIVKKIAAEAFMPFAFGGGIRTVDDVKNIIGNGAEKVVINSQTILNPELINEASEISGSQSIVVSIDVKRTLFGKQKVYISGGSKKTKLDPVEHAVNMAKRGAGEILINSIDRDGMTAGYDIELINSIAQAVEVPVVACGGAGSHEHMRQAVFDGGAHAVAAGSMFVFQGTRRAVLINYPEKGDLEKIFE